MAYLAGDDAAVRAEAEADWDANHAGGFASVRVLGAHPGSVSSARSALEEALRAAGAPRARSLAAHFRTHPDIQHAVAYASASKRAADALIVADASATISPLGAPFDHAHMGRPEEFDSLTLSFLYKGPKRWDVLWCDKGLGGVAKRDALKPALTLANPGWVGRYEVYRWAGDGVEAAPGLYAVSASFLEKLPGAIRAGAEALEDGGVKRWLGEMCASGELTCFSYLEKMRSADEAALGATRGRAEISWRDTTLVGDFFDDAA